MYVGLWVLVLSVGLLIVPLIFNITDSIISMLRFFSLFVFSVASLLLASFIFRRDEHIIARWNKLYYCERDDGVFDPKGNVLVPTNQMANYLYR